MVLPSKHAEPKSITFTSEPPPLPPRRFGLDGEAGLVELSVPPSSFEVSVAVSILVPEMLLPTVAALSALRGVGLLGLEWTGTNRMFSGLRSQWITSASSMATSAVRICLVKRCTTGRGNPRNWFWVSTSSRDTLSSSNTKQTCP
jgi:hypothetical protein